MVAMMVESMVVMMGGVGVAMTADLRVVSMVEWMVSLQVDSSAVSMAVPKAIY